MNHVIEILEIKHIDRNGKILWHAEHLPNILHYKGEEFILKAVFTGGVTNIYIPTAYYFGLDARSTLTAADDWIDVIPSEPTTHGYARVPISSTGQFNVSLDMTGHNLATSPIVTFNALGGSWGPVRNLFLATTIDTSGYLIASVSLLTTRTLADGESLSARIGLGLRDC